MPTNFTISFTTIPSSIAIYSYTAYISYIWVYHLPTPLTLIINYITSCRLLKYIHSIAIAPIL